MTSRLMQVLLGLSLLLNTFVLAGFVYRSWIAPPPFEGPMRPPPPPPAGPRPSPVETLVHELGLTDDQRQALRGFFDQYAISRRQRIHEIQQVREQTVAEMRRPEFDVVRIEALVDEMSRLRADLHKDYLRAIAQLEPKLRPEQRERMHEILAERFSGPPIPARPRTPGAPPPGGPPPEGPPRPPQ